MAVLTSLESPIGVGWLPVGGSGRLGLTFAPGKKARALNGDRWERDLGADLDRLVQIHGAQVLVPLIEDHELRSLGIDLLVAEAERRGLVVDRLQIRDGGLPERRAAGDLVARIGVHLNAGRTVVVHCRGGLGRAGTIGGCTLVSRGVAPEMALAALRAARGPGCPENSQQVGFITSFANTRAQ